MSGMRTFGKKAEGPKTAAVPSVTGDAAGPGAARQNGPAFSIGGADSRATAEAARTVQRDQLFKDLIDLADLPGLAAMTPAQARTELSELAKLVLSRQQTTLSMDEQEGLVVEVINDILGLGPLEQLLSRDEIADIMVCGPKKVYIEIGGKLQLTDIKFRDEEQLINICRRIVGAVGRRVDESSPICDARLMDGSRVAIVAPPLAIDGTSLTIRKFKKEKLNLDSLVRFGSISKAGAKVLEIASACRCNALVSGGTGSGKTTLLNCLTLYIDPGEAIITCEDAAELQLQQGNVRRWETRPPNLEGKGEITMSMLVKAALRHRPERIIIGEVRGKEAFDLLQAMNTGHDGSAGTVHANSPREAIGRVESMIAMGGYSLPAKTVREQIASSVDIIVQASRMRDGSRKVTHITEVLGLEGDTVVLQDLMLFKHTGEDSSGRVIGHHQMTGVRPHMFEKARYYGLERELQLAMQDAIS